MFNNLIESSSHGRELRRRGTFVFFTTISYALLFAIVGVISIHAYDAHMEDRNLEIVTLLPPVVAPPPEREPVVERQNNPDNNRRQAFDERRVAMAPIDRFERPPETISTQPNPDLPVRPGIRTLITGRDRNADFGSTVGSSAPGSVSNPHTSRVITEVEPPPAPPEPKPPKLISRGVITGDALYLPKPVYPHIAQQSRTQGVVSVQVLIDETGNVISAKAISGNPMLSPAAVRAAYQARFKPTTLSGQPVKVSGVITYNFTLQQ
jgi:protein TonB